MIKHLQSILDQDQLCTSDPVYVVYQKLRVWTNPANSDENVVYVRQNYGDEEEMSAEQFEALEEEFDRWDNGYIPDQPQYEEENFKPDDWEKATYTEVDKFCAACFTRFGAESYLAANGHNLNQPFVYTESMHRNQEMIDIRKGLIELARKEQNQNTDI